MVKCVCYRWRRWRHFKVVKGSMKNLFFFFFSFFWYCCAEKTFCLKRNRKASTLHVAIGRCRNGPVGCSALEEPAHSRMIASLNRTRIGSPFSPPHRYWIFFSLSDTVYHPIVIIVSAAYLARAVNALSHARTHALTHSTLLSPLFAKLKAPSRRSAALRSQSSSSHVSKLKQNSWLIGLNELLQDNSEEDMKTCCMWNVSSGFFQS